MLLRQSPSRPPLIKIIVVICIVALAYALLTNTLFSSKKNPADSHAISSTGTISSITPSIETVDLTDSQLQNFKIERAIRHSFRVEKEEVGSIAYQEATPRINNTSKFAVANVHESDSPLIHVGQSLEAKMLVYPDRVFEGKVSAVGVTVYDAGAGNPAIDPNTHRITVRCEITDPKNELYPGMLATIVIELQKPVESTAIAQNGVVREGDGTMTVWVKKGQNHFEKRIVNVGLRQDGYVQILDGLTPDELVVTDNAVFLSNMANTDSHDAD